MRTVRCLFDRLCDPDHLDRAARATVHGKRRRRDVAFFLFRRHEILARLAEDLRTECWRPSPFDLVAIRDPKPRLIARVSLADRIVHTALVMLMEPALTRGLMPEAFACRTGLGTHRAVLRLLVLMRAHRFAVHLDIRSYFPSIDTEILKRLLGRRIRDRRFLAVLDRVIDEGRGLYDPPWARRAAGVDPDWPPPGRGLPVGAYTSQMFAAHVYLCDLDHLVKRGFRVPGYVRYVDDLFLFGDRRADLREWRDAVGAWLLSERHLRLKHPRARVLSCRGHLDALGYRITREDIRPRPRALARMRRRIESEWARPGGRGVDFARSMASSAGVVFF